MSVAILQFVFILNESGQTVDKSFRIVCEYNTTVEEN